MVLVCAFYNISQKANVIWRNEAIAVCIGVAICFIINKLRCTKITITINKDNFTIDRNGSSRSYSRSAIKDMDVYNKYSHTTAQSASITNDGPSYIMVGSGIAGVAAVGFATVTAGLNRASAQVGNSIGQATKADMAKRAWALRILYGSKRVYVVKHMKRDAAEALYLDLCDTLNEIR
jgi:hypothetical protein